MSKKVNATLSQFVFKAVQSKPVSYPYQKQESSRSYSVIPPKRAVPPGPPKAEKSSDK